MQQVQPHTTHTDPFQVLGLDPSADEHAVRKAFRKLAFELHPDRNMRPDAANDFLKVRQAYELLIDPELRRAQEAELIAEQMERAAGAATRTRAKTAETGSYLRVVVPVRPPLLGIFGLDEQSATKALIGLTLAAACLVIATGVLVFVWLAVVAVCLIGLAGAIWLSHKKPTELAIYGHGFADSRWVDAGIIGWADIRGLVANPVVGVLDLELSAAFQNVLANTGNRPRGVLLSDNGHSYYRLYLGDQYDHVADLIAGRTGVGG